MWLLPGEHIEQKVKPVVADAKADLQQSSGLNILMGSAYCDSKRVKKEKQNTIFERQVVIILCLIDVFYL